MYASVRSWVERVRLWVDNVILIDQWTSLEGTENSGTIYMGTAGGYYDVVMEYKQPNGTGGDQGVRLSWKQNSTSSVEVVGTEYLYGKSLFTSLSISASYNYWLGEGGMNSRCSGNSLSLLQAGSQISFSLFIRDHIDDVFSMPINVFMRARGPLLDKYEMEYGEVVSATFYSLPDTGFGLTSSVRLLPSLEFLLKDDTRQADSRGT
eukprot:764901-Hanusia_phi.AAC.2